MGGQVRWAGEQVSKRAREWASERAGGQAREWASERAGQWASGRDKGGKQGERGERGEQGERQQFLFSVHHHPNFYDFFLRAIAPFTGISFVLMNLSVGPLSIMLQYEPVRKAIHFYLWIHLRARNQKIGEPIFILSLDNGEKDQGRIHDNISRKRVGRGIDAV